MMVVKRYGLCHIAGMFVRDYSTEGPPKHHLADANRKNCFFFKGHRHAHSHRNHIAFGKSYYHQRTIGGKRNTHNGRTILHKGVVERWKW